MRNRHLHRTMSARLSLANALVFSRRECTVTRFVTGESDAQKLRRIRKSLGKAITKTEEYEHRTCCAYRPTYFTALASCTAKNILQFGAHGYKNYKRLD